MQYLPDPLFSVVVPVYNRADLIRAAIGSILGQTLQDFEIVVVDDGSKDNVEDAVLGFGDARIRLIRQENSGSSSARNTGIKEARGKFVAFLDSDDLYLPGHLESVHRILSTHDRAVAYTPVLVRRGNGVWFVKPPRPINDGEQMADYLVSGRGFVQTSGVALPRTVAAEVSYRDDVSFGDDTDFAIRLSLAGYTFVMAAEPSVIWADDVGHARLSTERHSVGNLAWLHALKPHISKRAYHGYRGWYLAKSFSSKKPLQAMALYVRALTAGSYPPRLALVVLLQIILNDHRYRSMANLWLKLRPREKAHADTR